MATPIEDYALIGDTQTAALVSKGGSIDWMCLPRFDGGACFAALLGDESNGCWQIAPVGGLRRVTRRYRDETLVLETEFVTEDGTVRVVDCMSPRVEHPEVVRVVEGVRGRVPMRMQLVIRYDYLWTQEAAAGRIHPVIAQTYPLEHAAEAHAAIENRASIGKILLLT